MNFDITSLFQEYTDFLNQKCSISRHIFTDRYDIRNIGFTARQHFFNLHEEDAALRESRSLVTELLQQRLFSFPVHSIDFLRWRIRCHFELSVFRSAMVLGCDDDRWSVWFCHRLLNIPPNQSDISSDIKHFRDGKSLRPNSLGHLVVQ